MNTTYFDTRTQARNAVEALNGKFKDFGTDAPKGQRWAVISEVLDVKLNDDIQNQIALLKASIEVPDYVAVVVQKGTETVTNLKGKPVPVHYKKSVTLQPLA